MVDVVKDGCRVIENTKGELPKESEKGNSAGTNDYSEQRF